MPESNKEETLKEKIADFIKDWVKDTTSHGIPRVFKTKFKVIQILWLTCFLASAGYMIYTIVELFIAYYAHEVTATTIRVQELPATFPSITFCNLNPFNEQYAHQYIVKVSDKAKCFNLDNNIDFQNCFNTTNTNQAFDKFIDQLKRKVASDKRLTEAYKQYYGYSLLYDMLVSCDYNGNSCNADNFTTYWDNDYGNCYTFNGGKEDILKTSATGYQYGLKLELLTS